MEGKIEENDEKVKTIRSIIGFEIPDSEIMEVLIEKNNDIEGAINHLLDFWMPLIVKKTVTSAGVRISGPVNQENGEGKKVFDVRGAKGVKVNEEIEVGIDEKRRKEEESKVLDGCGANGVVGELDLGCGMVNGVMVNGEMEVGINEKRRKEEEMEVLDGCGANGVVNGVKGDEKIEVCMDEKRRKEEESKVLDECGANGFVVELDLCCKMVNGVKVREETDVCIDEKGQKGEECDMDIEGKRRKEEGKKVLDECEAKGVAGKLISGCGMVNGVKVKEEPDVSINEKGLKVKEEINEFVEVKGRKEEEKKVFDVCGTKGVVDKSVLGSEMVNRLKVKEELDVDIEEKVRKEEEKKDFDGRGAKGFFGKAIKELVLEQWIKPPKSNPHIDMQKPKEEKELKMVKFKEEPVLCVEPLSSMPLSKQEYNKLNSSNNSLSTVVIEDGDFPEDSDWLLVGRTVVTGLSTTKGRKLENNEIVHFSFPQPGSSKNSSQWGGSRAAIAAASSIVRFSTKRSGEIGRLPMEWAKCLIPLVNSSKVKVLGRCVAAPVNLSLMQELMLYVSFYIDHTVFTTCDKSSWRLDFPLQIDTTTYPLLTLFKLLKVKPFQNAEFTPEELDSRKRQLNLDSDSNEAASLLSVAKRRRGCQPYSEPNKDEQVISEASLNKLVGSVDVYDLKEMEAPDTLMCSLRSYQKEALYWMSESEKGAGVEEASKTLHPCWAAYRICEERKIYVNIFSGEATTDFPTASNAARGGILADAMGLGKTVMTIALILANLGRGSPDDQDIVMEDADETECATKRISYTDTEVSRKVKGGTLIDELEAHSKPDSVSVFVHYGGDRSNDPRVIADQDVVLTTYGVLTATYKANNENSIFHNVDWYRVVLDEAHTIKSWKTLGAQAAFTLSAHCRWCLTGTPLQNNLEDLYSLLCFLRVEPWCNWAWWSKLIQRPYENGDQRALKLIKAILRPLMLRRTKDTKDRDGRPILVLPPTDIQVIECKQSEAEHDFYDALFKRSKVQFDQFVAQGKVLHNYANILELLLRLRQCCNHPFLVMSRSDTQQFADLDKLARRFLETNPDSSTQKAPTPAYVEEVVEGNRNGENTECPICLESADDPVLTPCAHRMCRECLLSSWRTPASGLCPICRQMLHKHELLTCPSANRFRVDVEKNWQESSKASKLMACLKSIRKSGEIRRAIMLSSHIDR
ncbi:DNA repair protein RAD5B [Capsicum annuum]